MQSRTTNSKHNDNNNNIHTTSAHSFIWISVCFFVRSILYSPSSLSKDASSLLPNSTIMLRTFNDCAPATRMHISAALLGDHRQTQSSMPTAVQPTTTNNIITIIKYSAPCFIKINEWASPCGFFSRWEDI